MRVHVSNAALVEDLIEFLRRCQCAAEQIGWRTVEVVLEPRVAFAAALSLVRAGVCYGCGEQISGPLSRLGSPLCLDCRWNDTTAPLERQAGDEGRRAWARMELDAYLGVWQARHTGVRVLVSSDDAPEELPAAAGAAS